MQKLHVGDINTLDFFLDNHFFDVIRSNERLDAVLENARFCIFSSSAGVEVEEWVGDLFDRHVFATHAEAGDYILLRATETLGP